MKRLRVVLLALSLMLCTAMTAFADEIYPVEEAVNRTWPVLLIAVAVIVIAIIIVKIRKKK